MECEYIYPNTFVFGYGKHVQMIDYASQVGNQN